MKELIDRLKAPTPSFFKKVRNVGLTLAAVGGAILSAPVAVPAAMMTAAGYMVATGAALSAASQAAKKHL